ncbi:MAG TPA: hydantoinase B/oxoprolinase family protein [Burkholderiaceae bacterium]|nr:hydantoinase B/oxoprolinase family protein [Burkholderiaceae bacterium]
MSTAPDVVLLQVLWDRLLALVEEQAQILKRTAFSPIVRETGDLSVGVFDLRGRMLAQAVTGTPGHVNAMAESAGHFIRHFAPETMQPGDAFITNDPWMGTGHLNDFVVFTPCFVAGRLVAFFCCTSHITDVGGLGTGPDAPDVFAEGLSVPMLKLVDQGRMNETLLSVIAANSRLPADATGDTYSLAACNDVGVRRLQELFAEFGLHDLEELGSHMLSRSREAVLNAIRGLPKGTWRHTMTIDGYDAPLILCASLSIGAGHVHVDFAGSSPAVKQGINVPRSYAAAYAMFGLACVVAPEVPNNSGSLSPFSFSFPEGSIVNPARPLPVAARHIIGQMLPDTIFGCLSQAIPDRVPAEGTSCIWNISCRGLRRNGPLAGQPFALAVTTNGGTGARPHQDGLSATAFPSGVQGTSIEIFEGRTPIVVWRKELRPDSGGAGRTRGGLGQIIELQNTEDAPFRINAIFDRIAYPPRGRDGGSDGAAGYIGLADGRPLAGKGLQEIAPGQRIVVKTPGGAGIGDARSRSREQVARDLSAGLVSPEAARRDYGYR